MSQNGQPRRCVRWTAEERELLIKYYPDAATLRALLPTRTWYAIKAAIKAEREAKGLPTLVRPWTGAEKKATIAAYLAGQNFRQIAKMFPHRTIETLRWRVKEAGLLRKQEPSKSFRFKAVAQIRDECRKRGIAVQALARTIGTNASFASYSRTTSISAVIDAVEHLGGEIDIVWDQD